MSKRTCERFYFFFFFFAKWQMVEAILCSAAHFAISAFCTSVNFAYNFLLRLRGVLLFTLHALHLCVCGRDQGRLIVSDDHSLGTWQLLICTDWAKIAEERHGLNVRLQTKSYDCSEGCRPYEYTYNKSIQPSFTECNFRS